MERTNKLIYNVFIYCWFITIVFIVSLFSLFVFSSLDGEGEGVMLVIFSNNIGSFSGFSVSLFILDCSCLGVMLFSTFKC